MPCKTCNQAAGLQVCLFCGHAYCGTHRADRDGAVACTACLEAEHARRSARNRTAAKTSDRAPPATAGNGTGAEWLHVGPAAAAPPPLVPEPPFWTPLLAGAAAGVVAGAYLWFFLAWLLAGVDAPAWAQAAGTAAGAALAFAGVWIIVKSRMT